MSEEETRCGCRYEPTSGMAFSFGAAKPMPPMAEFTDNGHYIKHYCQAHWSQRTGAEQGPIHD